MFLESLPIDMTSDAAHESLEAALHDLVVSDFRGKWEATKQLANLGEVAIAPLVALLQAGEDEDEDWEVRWFAARALGQFDHPEALSALVQLVQQPQEAELVAIAAAGLSHFGDRGVDALVQLLDQRAHRLTSVQALASIQHSSVFVPLLAAAADEDPSVRATALAALANFRHPQVDKLLLTAVKDPHTSVRRVAITHLGMRSELLADRNLVEILLPGLWDIQPEVNEATAIALGRLGTETAVAALARVLSSPHTPARLQTCIIRALGWAEKESALLALFSALSRLPLTQQTAVVETLPRLQSPNLRRQAGNLLCNLLQTTRSPRSPDRRLIPAIALALGTLQHSPALPLLQTLAADADPQTQLYAAAALRQFAD